VRLADEQNKILGRFAPKDDESVFALSLGLYAGQSLQL
jgi:hypothetical protein